MFFFFFNDTATTEIYTLSLHDALPILMLGAFQNFSKPWMVEKVPDNFSYQLLEADWEKFAEPLRSEEHTSELQSRPHLVCRLLLEKKKIIIAYCLPAECFSRTSKASTP